jgi:hypothetical protein
MPPNNKSNITKFISKAILKHGEKYDYSKSVYIDQNTLMEIYCKSCEILFPQKPKAHLSGQGCPNCARLNHRLTNEEFIRNSKEIHGENTYDYSKCKYILSRNPVILICNNCKTDFSVLPNKHLNRKQGCEICSKNNRLELLLKNFEEKFWEFINSLPDDKYDFTETKFNGPKQQINVICKIHGPFTVREDTFRSGAGCRDCAITINKHKAGSLVNIEIISENWKQYEDSGLYFSPYFQFAYNYKMNSKLYPSVTGCLSHQMEDGNILFIDIIWKLFNGNIPKTKYVTLIDNNSDNKYLLENLKLEDYKCDICEIIFEGYNKTSKYCSKNCRESRRYTNEKNKRQTDFKYFMQHKLNSIKGIEKKAGRELDYDINNFTGNDIWIQRQCFWCKQAYLDYADNNPHNPNKLTIDSINPPYHNKFEELVPSCLLCNRMFQDMSLQDRNKLINYLTGKSDLDLSNEKYTKYNEQQNEETVPWECIKKEREYKNIEESRKVFLEVYNSQNNYCTILPNYPIFYFKHCRYSVSCDRVVAGNCSNYQLIPQFLNYAKNNLSNEIFIEELEKRNFLNTGKVKVILPQDYLENSYFIHKLKNGNSVRLGKTMTNNIKVHAIYKDNKKDFISIKECSNYYNISSKAINNSINNITDGYKHKEYGIIKFYKL